MSKPLHKIRPILLLILMCASLLASSVAPALSAESPIRVILFIGDGMGEAQRTAARWYALGQSGQLAMDRLAYNSWARTASADNPVTDSAAAATALATGVKTNNGRVAMTPDGAAPLTTILELAQPHGLAVGLVTTVQMAHATPASFAAHVPNRNQAAEIAAQMLGRGVNALLGGGEDEFLPVTATGQYPEAGERTDGRDLITEATAAGYTYVWDAAGLSAVDPAATLQLLGLFSDEEMPRPPAAPALSEMTAKAIAVLAQDPDGFFLMVEGGQIDWACHANDAARAITETLDFDAAVEIGLDFAATTDNTLVIVTGDHETGGMAVSLSDNGGRAFTMPDATPFYVAWATTTHTGADVPTNAQGPRADLAQGTYENTYIYTIMTEALKETLSVSLHDSFTAASELYPPPLLGGALLSVIVLIFIRRTTMSSRRTDKRDSPASPSSKAITPHILPY